MSKAAEAFIEKGEIVIRLPIKNLKMAVEGYIDSDFGIEPMIVTNAKEFAKGVVRALNDEEEDGTTPIHRMFDFAFVQALEDGNEGVVIGFRCDSCANVFPLDDDSSLCDQCDK